MLLKAMLEEYPEHAITGYLMDVHISSYCAHGRVYKHRGYGPGVLMLTETITSVLESDDGVRRYLIETVDGERLLVVNFHPTGGRRSLEILAAKFACAARLGSRYCEH
jgi:hypothetical protein